MTTVYKTLKQNKKARKNLIGALAAIDKPETYSNERCDRLADLRDTLRDIEAGYSGGNDTLIEKSLVWDGYNYTKSTNDTA